MLCYVMLCYYIGTFYIKRTNNIMEILGFEPKTTKSKPVVLPIKLYSLFYKEFLSEKRLERLRFNINKS